MSLSAVPKVQLFLSLFIIFGCVSVNSETQSKVRVENNLLPPVLIEGEQPYNLMDRMSYYNVPGVSIAVIQDFKIAWVGNYGMRDAELKEPVTDSTLFCIGSLSKSVTAATILNLAGHGKFSLDDNVEDYLKTWKVPENEFTKKSKVTIERLLNHSGGFMSRPAFSFAPDDMPTLIQYLNSAPHLSMPAARIDYEPGTAFKYANDGFGALQILVEDVTGQSFTDISRSVVFDPLGMKHSTFEQPLSPEKGLYAAAGHDNYGAVNDIKRYAYPVLAAGGLWSTSREFATFLIEIQRALKEQSDLIMSQESAKQMISPHEAKQYGFGVFLRNTDNVTYFSHIGDLKGFAAGFAAHPSDGYGAVVMTNSHNGINLIREITAGIAQIYNWEGYLPKPYDRYNLASATMSKYAGRYRAGFDYCYTVSEKEDDLYWSAPDGAEFQLYPISKDTLISKERKGQVVFVTGPDGEVSKCIFLFADAIGRLPAKETEALRMSEGELTPLEMLLSGQTAQATRSYKERKENLSNDFSVSENRLNNLGYQFLNQNKINEAMEVFRLNTVLYPKSANCWDSYAEALLTAGRKQDALLNYQKAYDLDPSSSRRAEKVRRLKSEL